MAGEAFLGILFIRSTHFFATSVWFRNPKGNMANDIEHFRNLNYEVRMKKQGTLYRCFIPELNCHGAGESPAEALEALDRKKEAYLQNMQEFKFLDEIKKPERAITKKSKFRSQLNLFFIKMSMVLGIFLIGALFTYQSISPKLREAVQAMKEGEG